MTSTCALALALLGGVLAPPGAAQSTPAPVPALLPFPNDALTRPDRSTPTGRRVALRPDQMPRNAQGVPIDPTDHNRADGFSPGSLIVARLAGLDTPEALARSGAVPVTDLARTYDRDQPVVVIDARTRRRQLVWAELDATANDPSRRALLVRPARNLREGRRYVVALRRLRGTDGRVLPPDPAFAGRPLPARIAGPLRAAGIARRDLQLAWDFTVASRRSLSGRLLSMRERAFAALGDRRTGDLRVEGRPPPFTVSSVTDFAACGADGCQAGESDDIQRRVAGTVTVPCYLDQAGCPAGSRFRLDARGLPVRTPGNVHEARFICNIPRSASPGTPGRLALYGHGLFGLAEEVDSVARGPLARQDGVVLCASDWIGMSAGDIPNAVGILQDLSRFPTLVDRLQQGILDFLVLGRAMRHPAGFARHPAFRRDGRALVDPRRLYYVGGSQGGIIGGALTAVAPDFTRSVLVVGGMNYSTLLTRSIDFDRFAAVLYPAYPDELVRPLALSLVQMLWDRGEANGYAQHMTDDPLPDTPRHRVLLHMAYGDHQVANIATETMARTIGARLRTPALDPGRSPDARPFYGIPPVPRLPWPGDALVVWDIGPLRPPGCGGEGAVRCEGTAAPPTTNLPPRLGRDPHGVTARDLPAQQQFSAFLRPDGALVDTCAGRPCYAGGWTGP